MPGSLGLWRSVIRRMRADWAVVVAATLLLLIATALLATSVFYGDTVALAGVRRSIEAAAPIDRGVLVRTTIDGDRGGRARRGGHRGTRRHLLRVARWGPVRGPFGCVRAGCRRSSTTSSGRSS